MISERTKGRPLASGRVSVFAAFVYLIPQYLAGILLFSSYKGVAVWAGIAQLLPLYVCHLTAREPGTDSVAADLVLLSTHS